ncbi:hypothetical protein AM500_08355 [Bacillus sp. FJAT-18017]|uniref:PilW family protein n=1 Tax=Bacillus sp. FJAT-18017 TaxID=1705566 RepID=UPI0006AF5AEF|nr:prepilin-type N-terminal cleavage/methylation domain-containing protein [Bacillus sp. FJAT-18017]ALC89782.1 hypothetical protein AM500_08355 [Bacillus sp. FJAT-18017]
MKNDRGVTLIELLAALSLILVVSGLLYGVLIGTNKNYDTISEKGNLNREANLILATITNYHHKQELHTVEADKSETYVLKYDPLLKKGFIGKSSATLVPLQPNTKTMYIEIDGASFSGEKKINTADPLYIYLKVENQQNQTYEIETIIKQY